MTRKASRPGLKELARQPVPCGNGNFLVDLGMGDARATAAGFCGVIFPEFMLPTPTLAPRPEGAGAVAPVAAGNPHLVLRRAATGALDLYQWWRLTRTGGKPAPRRTVTIDLLGPDMASTVLRWRFLKASPFSLAYSPLDALAPGLLYETLALEFAGLEMEAP